MATKGDSARPQLNSSPSNSTGGVPKDQSVLADNNTVPTGATGNRKKQKKRQKQQQQAVQQADTQDSFSSQALQNNPHLSNGNPSQPRPTPNLSSPTAVMPSTDHLDYHDLAQSAHVDPNTQPPSKSSKKKKKTKALAQVNANAASNNDAEQADKTAPQRSTSGETSLWDTNGPEERSRIKAFWLNLTESERRDLVNIEKSHVLQKMKEQQKHSCSCSVCGRKRTAIEEELESLLKDPRIWADPTTNPPTDRLPTSTASLTGSSQRRHPDFSDDQDDDDYHDDDPAEYSDEYDDEDEDYSDDIPDNVASDFFHFGNSLTVKDGLLTVADDLLKNDGQKFIDMMEQLAERRMQREEDARYSAAHGYPHGSLSPPHGANHLGEPPLEDDEYDDEEDEFDDDADLEYDDEDEEEMDTLTEEQRMEEGRRMFQIFAARMFEQRVVTAYREKVAYERQQALIDEQEQNNVGTSEGKKSKNAEKKKRQRQAAKEAKALKEAAKEEEKQRKEAATRVAEEKKKEEQRLKQEEARKKKEAEKQALEEKRRKKEAEAQKRLGAERERQQEQERKNREQKAEEKRRREDAEKKKREEREAREREAEDKKLQEDSEKKDREDRARAEKEVQERTLKPDQETQSTEAILGPSSASTATAPAATTDSTQLARTASSEAARRPPPTAAVAVPPALKPRTSQTSHDSPLAKIATPALPKAPTPSRVKETPSLQTAEPFAAERTPQSRSSSSPRAGPSQSIQPPGIPLARQHPIPVGQPTQQPSMPLGAPLHQASMQQPPTGHHFATMPFGVNGLPGSGSQLSAPAMRGMPASQQASMYPAQGVSQSPFGSHPHRGGTQNIGPSNQSSRAPIADYGSGTFNQQLPSNVPPLYSSPQREGSHPSMQHTRQLSNQFEGLSLDTQSVQPSAAAQPIGRPAPIKRPASVNKSDNRTFDRPKSSSRNQEVDDLSNHLGSSALLDDTDEPLPSSLTENRRPSAAPGSMRSSASAIGSPFDYVASPFGSVTRAQGDSWNRTPAMSYGAPGMPPPPANSQASSAWGGVDVNSPSHGWGSMSGSSSNANAFGMQSHHRSAGGNPRAVTVRLFTVQACKSLASQSSGVENSGFFDISDVVRVTVEGGRQMHLNPGIQLNEIRNILDTEGDSNNGGGTFLVRTLERKGSMGERTMVRWVPDQTPMDSFPPRQTPFYHQHPSHHQPSHQAEHLQGESSQGSAGGVSGGRHGLGLGDVGSPVSDARLPNLGGFGRF